MNQADAIEFALSLPTERWRTFTDTAQRISIRHAVLAHYAKR